METALISMKSLRHSPVQPRRDAWVEVDLGAIERNARIVRASVPAHVDLMAVVKADAYGHGAAMALPTLEASGVRMAGVAAIDEAIQLRQAGIRMPILVMGAVPDWAVRYALEYDIRLTVFTPAHLESLRQAQSGERRRFRAHIKVDTGMHRIGIPWERTADFVRQCRQLDFLEVEGIFSHLADSFDPELTRIQTTRWQSALDQIDPLPRYVHISNSGHALTPGALASENRNNLARLGIAFFGYGSPPLNPELRLEPAMSLKARIIHLQDAPPDTGVSYGHTYKTPPNHVSRIATTPVGYADGVPRILSGRIEGLLAGSSVPQAGTITMDQMMFDVTDVPQARIGDVITLIGKAESGEAIWLDDWAEKAGTIEYELMCALRVRLPKTYTR